MSSGSDSNLQSQYEFNSLWAERVATLIIVGLGVEILSVFILEKPFWWEGVLTIASSVLIVAGVWGELIFEKRAKSASDGIVAEANARAAEADARAAEAHLELARLQKKLEPRAITTEGEAKVVKALEPFPAIPFSVKADPAAEYAFVNRLIAILQRAGWVCREYLVTPCSLPTGHIPGLVSADESHLSGVQIRINRTRLVDFERPARALSSVLTQALQAGVAIVFDPPDSPLACSPDAVHVEIFRKL